MEAVFIASHILSSENRMVFFKLWWNEDLQSLDSQKDGIIGLSE